MLNRAMVTTDRGAARAPGMGAVPAAPTMAMDAMHVHQGRGNAALYLADRILRQAQPAKDIVSPDMENGDATVGDGSPEQEMEPLDPTIAPRQADDKEEPTDGDEEDIPRVEDEKDVDITIVNVDEENELVEDEPAPEEMAA